MTSRRRRKRTAESRQVPAAPGDQQVRQLPVPASAVNSVKKLPAPDGLAEEHLPIVAPRSAGKAVGIWQKVQRAAKKAQEELDLYRSILKHPRTPLAAKALFGGAILYALSPVDLVPDFLPAMGWLDDLIVVPAMAWLALELVPDDVIEECRERVKAGNPPPGTV